MKTVKSTSKRKAEAINNDSDSDVSPVTKKASTKLKNGKAAVASSKKQNYSTSDLTQLSHADLIAYAISLQKQLEAKPPASSPNELSPEQLAKKVQHLRAMMACQIRKSMTWKHSCKTGSATFSQDFIVQSEQILKALFKPVIKEAGKTWKMKKFSTDDFEGVVGQGIEASIRYGTLVLTSDVTVRWDATNGTLKCSGKYGKFGTGPAFSSTMDGDHEDGL